MISKQILKFEEMDHCDVSRPVLFSQNMTLTNLEKEFIEHQILCNDDGIVQLLLFQYLWYHGFCGPGNLQPFFHLYYVAMKPYAVSSASDVPFCMDRTESCTCCMGDRQIFQSKILGSQLLA